MRYPPISDYALIGDCHSAALVSRAGSVDWCCFHRFDARPVFGRILDWDRGGFFQIAPRRVERIERRYLPGTNVLESGFETSSGVLSVTDCMPLQARGEYPPAATTPHPHHQLLRMLRCTAGEVDVDIELRPRFDYGRTVPRMELRDGCAAVVYGGADALVIDASFPLELVELCGCASEIHLRAGDEAFVAVTYRPPHRLELTGLDFGAATDRLHQTVEFWRGWSSQCTYQGDYGDAVVRSALVLKALTNAPTGAIVAAPTTSLPEIVGGVRNWDYRYVWLRDAALDLYALFTLGYSEEAHAFMSWLRRTTAGRAAELQPLYGVGGESMVPEVELCDLEGYRGSCPVRIGNAAANQLQLDVYGELVDTAWLYHRRGGDIDDSFWEFICDVVAVVEARWSEPDDGIWEVRDHRRHFVSSKVMAWVAVDRAIRLAEALRLPADLDRWRRLRRAVRRRVETEGIERSGGGFARSFGSGTLDASNLLIPLVRFLPPNDPRVIATWRRVEAELSVDGLVRRYSGEDGLPGDDGAFVICSFWLVDNLALAGELGRATELFERILGYANDVGLLAEEIDPGSGELLGNFPQAFSHVGLVGAAINLAKASVGRRA